MREQGFQLRGLVADEGFQRGRLRDVADGDLEGLLHDAAFCVDGEACDFRLAAPHPVRLIRINRAGAARGGRLP
jgi:hypothetical protein